MARLAWLLFLIPAIPATAGADIRLDLEPMPDLVIKEPIYHLDRFDSGRSRTGYLTMVGIGYGVQNNLKGGVGEGALSAAWRNKTLVLAASSEMSAGDNNFVRGRHQGYLEYARLDNDDNLGGVLRLRGTIEHGQARGLAPVWLGPGKREHAAADAEALIRLDEKKDDFMWAALVEADGSVTRWIDAPALAHTTREALTLGLAFIPTDGEIPGGRLDVLRARVEHAEITRQLQPAGALLPKTEVRTIEVMTGVHELTFHIDHELLLALNEELGATWIEADTTSGRTLSDTFFKTNTSVRAKWRKSKNARQEIGLAIAREPGPSPDGQHLASDWRLEVVSGHEDKYYVINLRGGISWITHKDGQGDPATIKRYGSHIEAFAKITHGFEAGFFHAVTFEPQIAGDPWASPRRWTSEGGLLLRLRTKSL